MSKVVQLDVNQSGSVDDGRDCRRGRTSVLFITLVV